MHLGGELAGAKRAVYSGVHWALPLGDLRLLLSAESCVRGSECGPAPLARLLMVWGGKGTAMPDE